MFLGPTWMNNSDKVKQRDVLPIYPLVSPDDDMKIRM